MARVQHKEFKVFFKMTLTLLKLDFNFYTEFNIQKMENRKGTDALGGLAGLILSSHASVDRVDIGRREEGKVVLPNIHRCP